jgi:membrane protein DedA with SNARE-associated domain
MEGLTDALLGWLSDHRQWLGLAIFLIALVESLALAGLLVPGVVLLVAATAMAGSGGMGMLEVLALAFAGAVCGDLLSFILGRLFHQDIKRMRLFQRHPQWIDRGEGFFRRYGMLSVLIGRFVGPIRPVIPLVAGMFDMPAWRFMLVNLLSALAWAPVYVLPGYLAGQALHWDVPQFFWPQALGLAGSLAALALGSLLILRTQTRWAPLAVAGLTAIGLPLLVMAKSWLGVLESTIQAWLLIALERGPALLDWTAPLNEWPFLLLSVGLPALLLAVWQQWRQLCFLLMTLALTSGVARLAGPVEPLTQLATGLALILAITVLSNREQGFWRRVCWLVYLIPASVLVTSASLTPLPLSPLSLVQGVLLACTGVLLSLWLIERVAIIGSLPRPLPWLLPVWPLLLGALLAGLASN